MYIYEHWSMLLNVKWQAKHQHNDIVVTSLNYYLLYETNVDHWVMGQSENIPFYMKDFN